MTDPIIMEHGPGPPPGGALTTTTTTTTATAATAAAKQLLAAAPEVDRFKLPLDDAEAPLPGNYCGITMSMKSTMSMRSTMSMKSAASTGGAATAEDLQRGSSLPTSESASVENLRKLVAFKLHVRNERDAGKETSVSAPAPSASAPPPAEHSAPAPSPSAPPAPSAGRRSSGGTPPTHEEEEANRAVPMMLHMVSPELLPRQGDAEAAAQASSEPRAPPPSREQPSPASPPTREPASPQPPATPTTPGRNAADVQAPRLSRPETFGSRSPSGRPPSPPHPTPRRFSAGAPPHLRRLRALPHPAHRGARPPPFSNPRHHHGRGGPPRGWVPPPPHNRRRHLAHHHHHHQHQHQHQHQRRWPAWRNHHNHHQRHQRHHHRHAGGAAPMRPFQPNHAAAGAARGGRKHTAVAAKRTYLDAARTHVAAAASKPAAGAQRPLRPIQGLHAEALEFTPPPNRGAYSTTAGESGVPPTPPPTPASDAASSSDEVWCPAPVAPDRAAAGAQPHAQTFRYYHMIEVPQVETVQMEGTWYAEVPRHYVSEAMVATYNLQHTTKPNMIQIPYAPDWMQELVVTEPDAAGEGLAPAWSPALTAGPRFFPSPPPPPAVAGA